MKKNFTAVMLLFLLFSIFLIPKNASAMVKKIILFDSNYNTLGSYTNNLDSLAVNVQNVSKIRFELGENLTKDSIYNFDSKFFITTLDNYASIDWNIVADCGHNFETNNYWGTGHQVMGSRSYFYYINSQFNFTALNNCTTPFYEINLVNNFHVTNIGVDHINATFVSKDTNLSPVLNGQTEIKSKIDEMISYQDKLTQDTIDNDNKNTDKIIDENNKNFNDCRDSNNLLPTNVETISKNGLTITRQSDGSYILNGTCTKSDFFDLYNGSDVVLSPGSYIGSPGHNIPFYIRYNNSDYKQIGFGGSSIGTFNITSNFIFNRVYLYIGEGKTYNNVLLKFQLNKGTTLHPFEEYGKEVCKNRLDSVNDSIQDTNQSIKDMNDYISSDKEPNTNINELEGLTGLLPPGPLDSFLNLPAKFLNIFISSLNDTCVPLTFIFVFDKPITLPCFNTFYAQVPNYLMNFLNLIPTCFIAIKYFKHLYKKVERATSFESNSDDEWGVL